MPLDSTMSVAVKYVYNTTLKKDEKFVRYEDFISLVTIIADRDREIRWLKDKIKEAVQ